MILHRSVPAMAVLALGAALLCFAAAARRPRRLRLFPLCAAALLAALIAVGLGLQAL